MCSQISEKRLLALSRLSVCTKKLGSQCTDYHELWNLSFRKSVEKIRVSSKSEKNNGYFTWRSVCIFIISRSDLLRIGNVSNKIVEKIKTHILRSVTFFENPAVYEIMRKNVVQSDTSQTKIWRRRIACWIPKATKTLSECVILNTIPLQQCLHWRASMLCYEARSPFRTWHEDDS